MCVILNMIWMSWSVKKGRIYATAAAYYRLYKLSVDSSNSRSVLTPVPFFYLLVHVNKLIFIKHRSNFVALLSHVCEGHTSSLWTQLFMCEQWCSMGARLRVGESHHRPGCDMLAERPAAGAPLCHTTADWRTSSETMRPSQNGLDSYSRRLTARRDACSPRQMKQKCSPTFTASYQDLK